VKIDHDNSTLTYLLGYLKPEQWNDAVKVCSEIHLDLDLIKDLAGVQKSTYGADVLESDKDE
jgi:hypothetical protein